MSINDLLIKACAGALVREPAINIQFDGTCIRRYRHADVAVAVALDETLARYSPVTVLEAGAADVMIVKPMVLGGPSRARAVANVARGADVVPVVTTTVDGVVARLGAVHLAASLPDLVPAGLATGGWLADDLAPDPVSVVAGRASVPQGPGHGVDVEEGEP